METALPSSVQCWLGNELEIRGIDSVIYSRYIIHLLLEDHDEECTEYLELFFNPRLDIRSKLKNHKRLYNREEKKKKAAIECLQAVSEENCGIEKLVEELCNKLKEISQSSGSDDTDQGDSTPPLSDGSCSELEDPAERYYAAFPALIGQNEKSPNSEHYQQNLDIWKDNPLTKPSFDKQYSRVNKYKKTYKRKDERRRTKKKYSPNSQEKKKQTPEKPIPKPKSKSTENFHARFMSWPQSDFVPVNHNDKQTSEEKKLCQQVENILKQMLLSDRFGKKIEIPEYDSDGFISPELQENAFWYTNQFAELINPVESGQRLYERHSCPFFHNDDVFIDPDTKSFGDHVEELPLDDDQFGLQDLMKNQELQIVTESVLQNVDQDFSESEINVHVSDVKSQDEVVQCPFEIFKEIDPLGSLLFDEKVVKPSPSPYDNAAVDFPYVQDNATVDLWSTSLQDNDTDSPHVLCPDDDVWSATLQDNETNHTQGLNNCTDLKPSLWWMEPDLCGLQSYSAHPTQYEPTVENISDRSEELSLPSWMFAGNKVDDEYENYSQLWDINIWNKTHNNLQRENRTFLDGFECSFDDFRSGLNELPERACNRNSGVFNINLLDEGLNMGENINTLIPKITFEAVDLNMMARQTQDENQHYLNRAYDRSISLTDVHLLKTLRDDIHQHPSKDKLSRSFELIPSSNSAFKDVVQKKMTHVRSDSNISYFNYSTLIDFEDNKQQTKDEEDKKENLYLSHKTHFRPISAEEDMSDLHLRDLFGGYSYSRTHYQKYQDSGDEDTFVPMFRVCSQHDKYIQTGTSIDEQPINVEKMSFEDQGRPPESIEEEQIDDFTQEFDVYGYVDSLTASAQNTPQNVLDVVCNTCCDSGYEEANDDEKNVEEKSNLLTVSQSHRRNKAMEWPRQKSEEIPPDSHDFWVVTDSEKVGEINSGIWSCNEDNFPDMFSFFTEDCDDLKPQDVHEHNPQVSHTPPPPCYVMKTETSRSDVEDQSEIPDLVTKVKLVIGKGQKVLQDIENCPQVKNVSQPIYVKGYMPMPRVAVYSCELEKEWLDNESPQSYGKSMKPFKSVGRKPCSFFMEGSCKRSDCKFSHDLSTIICRFWEEGDCFKGDLCPFLHSYYASEIPIDIKENVEEHFEFQEEEFPQLSNPIKKQRMPKTDKFNTCTYVDSRNKYRTSRQKSTGKLT